MHKEAEHFKSLHEQNVSNSLPKDSNGIICASGADAVLPPLLMKHAQSESRLDQYLKVNPEARDKKVNKKGETLKKRQSKYVHDVNVEEKECRYSNSIEHKRKAEILALHKKL